MKILVDVIPFDGGKSGISQYALHVVQALKEAGHELTLVTEPGVAAAFFPGFRAIEAPAWTRRAVFSMLWHLFCLPRKIRQTGCDAMLLLAANRRALRRCPIPTVGVVHDLSQYHVAAKYDALRMLYIKCVLPHFVRRLHRVVAISKSTAADLVRHWRIPAGRIRIVYNGFTAPETEQSRPQGERNAILYISRLEHPGKNHVGLIEAYGKLPPEVAAAHPLVLAGGDWNGSEAVHAAAEASPYRAHIRLAGFVPNGDLPRLWSEAAVYAFPSRFEGFGLSLLEAMAAGVPVVCSKTSSLGELGAGVAELFDPESSDEIAAALLKVLTGDNAARIAAGRARAASFSWAKCAAELLDSFPPANVFGVPIRCETMAAALARIAAARDPEQPKFFAFVNAHCLNLAYADASYAEILRRCDAVWPDGTGVRMAGRRLGFPVPENVNGTDLFPRLSGRVFLYGAAPGVAERAAANIRAKYPAMTVVGTADGFGDERAVIDAINRVRPDILLVAKGVPRQEKWIDAHLGELKCGCAIAVGGLLDFVSGRIPRAPLWMRRHGVEWLYRLKCEPLRMFRRYVIGNPLFLMRIRHAITGGVKSRSIGRRLPQGARRIFAAVVFACLVGAFAVPAAACHLGWLTRWQLVPALMAGAVLELAVLAVSVALSGRLYCSVVCPLGVAQDLVRFCFSWLPFARPLPRPSRAAKIVRWSVLVGFACGAAFGVTGLLAPYGIFGRFIAVGVRRVGEPTVAVVVWSVALFAAIMVLAVFRARWWCNRVCPVGTLLGLLSRRSVFRVRVDADACVKCGLCAKRCDKGALTVGDDKSVVVDAASCVACFNCVGTCRKGALKWR